MSQTSPRPAATVLAVSAIFISSFYLGRQSFGATAPFSHRDVLNAVETCGDDQFIGGCHSCSSCSSFEYEAGGCSYFKDTFCTLCEEIKHCPQENILCSTRDNERCSMCDPGYWDDDCKPCSVCDPGYWELTRCTQQNDTVCTRCTECQENFRVTTACTYYSDTQCTMCRACKTMEPVYGADGVTVEEGPNFFKQTLCETTEATNYEFPRNVYTLGADTVCAACAEPVEGETYVSMICDMYNDTTILPCDICGCQDLDDYPADYETLEEAWAKRLKYETDAEATDRQENCQYRSRVCLPGDYNNLGETTECSDCTPRQEGEWEVFACTGDSDALWKECATCARGEYQDNDCGLKSDVSCPDCNTDLKGTYLKACEEGELTCTDGTDTVCEGCQDLFYGPTCCYHKYHGACGSITTRERAANRGGFEGNTDSQFIQFCMELCDEFPTCMAFELTDNGENLDESGPTPAFTDARNSICYFKSAYTQVDCNKRDSNCDWETSTRFQSTDPSKDCYSNVCRQNGANQQPKMCTAAMRATGQCQCPLGADSCQIIIDGTPQYEDVIFYYPEAYPVDGKPPRDSINA